MHLYLSDRSPLNTILTNADGQVLYKVETPFTLGSRTSTVTRVIPNDIPGNEEEPSMQDRYEYFGEVEHNPISSSVLRFGGNQFETNTFFRKAEWAPNGRSRIFTGPDGQEYKWLLQRYTPKARCFSYASRIKS
ncbi:hypothetical protein H0H92_010665 [Tricholoma furcatifolium]|nr:hypothetical protein H0H92_010665 [Tricholoma furcatifolium]